ncbi:MAG TPA: hypothetical protein PLI65_04490 [Bacteroidales bacterium]|nr:hypothetical protein [Bacteroidales bacterium]HPR57510.1 hypothetical protein [Bacteroidales bacterium]HRW97467.1 hypothetical protein [Bacteroidales bacterium]
MLRFIRSYIIQILIKKEMRKVVRTKKVVNLSQAQSIGIIIAIDNEATYQYINRIVSSLIQDNKEVKIIAFFPLKMLPNYYITKLKMDAFLPKDVNLLGLARPAFVENFIKQEFDLLIDLTTSDFHSLNYIAGCSHANFKVGRYRENMIHVFDFMIKKPSKMSNNKFCDTVFSYLRTINSR